MKIVALEEHFMLPQVLEANLAVPLPWRDPQLPGMNGTPMLRALEELGEQRLGRMDAAGIEVQVLSLSTPGTQSLDPAQAVTLARQANDALAQTAAAHPTRFQGFATLPTPDPQAAADELRRAVLELGMKGAMLNGHTRGRPADDRLYWPIYRAAQDLRAPLYLHPQVPVEAVRNVYYSGLGPDTDRMFAAAGLGWHIETGVQALRLMLSGVFDEYPDLQLILGHWGELLPFYLRRIDSLLSRPAGLQRPLRDVMRQNLSVTPSGMLEQELLRATLDLLGVDRILFALDDPFVPVPPQAAPRFLQDAQVSDEDREKIAHGNWDRLTAHLG